MVIDTAVSIAGDGVVGVTQSDAGMAPVWQCVPRRSANVRGAGRGLLRKRSRIDSRSRWETGQEPLSAYTHRVKAGSAASMHQGAAVVGSTANFLTVPQGIRGVTRKAVVVTSLPPPNRGPWVYKNKQQHWQEPR